jgi:hypothetical protein
VTFGRFLLGSLGLIAIALAIGFAAGRLRRRLLPGWSGAAARLAEVVLGLSILVVILELIGVVGLYRPGFVLAGAIVAGIGIGILAGDERPDATPLPAPAIGSYALAIALAGATLVAVHWAMPTQTGLDIGMYLPNTTWHNAPFAARFVQDHQVGALHFTEVLRLTVWFYPQNSELLHSAAELFLGTDFLSPLVNIVWMALCLLAAWVFGRPYGAAATSLLAIALIVDAEMLLLYQPGDAKNDIAGLFFLLASAALIVNADAQRRAAARATGSTGGHGNPVAQVRAAPPIRAQARSEPHALPTAALVVAGLAAGLALGTKLNLLAPFALLTLGVIAVAGRGNYVRTTLVWVASSLVTGGFWFARNLVEAGNPIPWFQKGPLPGPDQLHIDIREPHTVSDYLTNTDVIKHSFVPGLHHSFGPLWPVTLAALLLGILLAMFRGRTPVLRMLGFVALLSGVAYLFTPLTAAGPLNHPTAFEVNVRYAAPALGLGAMLLAVEPALSRGLPQRLLLGFLAILLLVSALPIDAFENVWQGRFLGGGILLAVMLVLVPVAIALAVQRGVPGLLVGAGIALALAIAIGIGEVRKTDYLDGRYQAATAPEDFPPGMRAAERWFDDADLHHARIAVVGGRPGFKQYIFYGNDLSNYVQYVAHHGPHGTFRPITSCREWRQAIDAGRYRYLIAGPDQRTQGKPPIEATWTGTDPAAKKLLEDDMIFVFRLDGPLDPAACARA